MRRPVTPTFVGVFRTTHLWLDRRDRARVLALWRPGADLRELQGGWLLILAEPVRIDTRRAPGAVLLPVDGRQVSAPIDRRDLAETPAGALVLLRGGKLVAAAPDALTRVNPSRWLDLPQPVATGLAPLGHPPVVRLAAAPIALDLRSRVGFAEASSQALAAALQRFEGGAGALDGVRSALASLLGGLARAGASVAGSSAAAASALSRLERFAEALGLEAALNAVVGAHNARYLQDLLNQLDAGNWLDAIARGIPLGGEGGASAGGLAWLQALQGIRFRGAAGGGGVGVGAPANLYERLRALYERAFQALAEQGLVREAAYVKADLLGDVAGAVAFLEERGEERLAAELAETKGLDPGLVVALWIAAGELERALALAVVRGAFGTAVEHLERRRLREPARALRLVWARREHLAGRAVAAVTIAWPVEDARAEARGWLDAAIAAGGPGGAKALAKSVAVRPSALAADLERVRELLAHDSVAARRTLAESLEGDPVSKRVLREVARALVQDAARLRTSDASGAARRAVDLASDGALPADLPQLPTGLVARSWPAEPVGHPIAASDTGPAALFDAVPLPRGRWLVAAGEAGAWLVERDGRRLVTFAAPTHRLVATRDGTRALLVGDPVAAGGRSRLSRLALPERTVERWVDVELAAFAEEMDGSVWFVAQGDRVLALDALAPGLRALWEVDRLAREDLLGRRSERVLALRWDPDGLRILVPAGADVERFRYELPSLALRERRTWPTPAGATGWALTDAGFLVSTPAGVELVWSNGVSRGAAPGASPLAAADGLLFAASSPTGVLGFSGSGLGATLRLSLPTPGATRTRARVVHTVEGARLLVVVDDRGRLRAVDLADGSLHADLRIG